MAQPVIDWEPGEASSWQSLSRLGPRKIDLRIQGELTAERAEALRPVRNADIELDLGGRVPTAGELGQLSTLDRVGRLSGSPGRPLRSSSGACGSRARWASSSRRRPTPFPPRCSQSWKQSSTPTCVVLKWPVSEAELDRLEHIPQLSLEIDVGKVAYLPRQLRTILARVGPSSEPHPPPDGGFTDPFVGEALPWRR